MEILTSVLKRLETKESGSDAEKINELIKVSDIFLIYLTTGGSEIYSNFYIINFCDKIEKKKNYEISTNSMT